MSDSNKNGIYFKAKRSKIRALEKDIAKMKKENDKIFGTDTELEEKTEKKSFLSNPYVQLILFVIGVACVGIGLSQLCTGLSITTGFAKLTLGNMQLTQSIFSFPLASGILMFILCRRKGFSLAVIALGTLFGFIGLVFKSNMQLANITGTGLVLLLLLIAAGIALVTYTAIKMRNRHIFD